MTSTKQKRAAATTQNTELITLNNNNTTNNYNTKSPEHIDKKHWEEWLLSGVSEKIIAKNVRSIKDSLEVDKLLNRNNKSRWKHSNSLIPCWAVSGVDPQTGEPTLLGVQVKPDTSILNKQGKLQKYIGASAYQAAPLFLDIDIEGFWQQVITDLSKPIIITEGAKKAAAGLSINYTTISIPGVSTCKKNGRLHELLKLFTGFGRTFYLCFDNDIVVKKPVQNAMLGLAKDLSATGSKVMVIELPPGELKGMDDFINQNGKDEFDKLFHSAKTVEEWRKSLEELWIKQQLEEGEEEKCKLKRQFEIIRDGWGEGLRLNQMKNRIELAGQPLDLDQIRLHMVLEFGEQVPIGDAQAIVQMLGGQNAYHPVADYLENVAELYSDVDISILDNLATRYFGSDNELHNIYMKKTLLAAVARIMKPGCKLDAVTILVNPKQGIGKSTFWRNLFGDDWFSDDMGDANEKDERMKMHQFWCLEWSEFENVYKKKDVSALKKFITTSTDSYRTPYSRTVKEYPRRSILVGTTNEQEILADPTGSRRFWVIPVKGRIPVEQLTIERDRLWAAAFALYKTGEEWKLTDEQEEQREEFNKQFQVVDPWLAKIQEYVEHKNTVTLSELFTHLDIEVARQDVGLSKRIGAVMNRLGWATERKRSAGHWVRIFTKTQKVDFFADQPGTAPPSISEGDIVSNTTMQEDSNLSAKKQQNQVDHLDQSRDTVEQELETIKPTTDPDDPLNLPKFLENITQENFYKKQYVWSLSLALEVRIYRVYPSVKKADVIIPGEPFDKLRLPFSDLCPVQPKFLPADEVEVLRGKHKGQTLIVDFIDKGEYWLKKSAKGFQSRLGPFDRDDLKLVRARQ
ncbi:VapE domain-containing protein [Nostoc sp. PA-18-2419]|uniref:VapE domain-containing protein n=1 Tax=Nostoc sp. PA-18-2419 TaxID=2575443 RepID=UPI0011089B1E|nr:VapE domain-containing protein [Nostoc sp. PA-18-2419]